MLNWVEEEKQYVDKAVDNYLKEQAKMPLGFMISKKTLNKNIEKIKEKSIQEYRYNKLMKYEAEVQEERKKIKELVNEINDRFNQYFNTQKEIVSNTYKPFKIECKEYKDYNDLPLKQLEIVSIQCEPFKISFIQEKINNLGSDE